MKNFSTNSCELPKFSAEQLSWSSQYGMQARKPTAAELSPGARKNIGLLGMGQKSKKGIYGEEEDSDPTNADVYFGPSIFGRDIMSTSLSQSFGSSLYGQPGGNSLGVGSLGLQPTPRGIGGQHMSRGLGSSSISGHVTPTSTGIQSFPNSISNSLPPQQPSPNRNVLALGSRGILGQQMGRDVKRSFPTSMNMAGFGLSHSGRGFSSQGMMAGSLQSSMGSSFSATATNDTPSFDPSEFPSLTNRGRQDNSGSSSLVSNPMAGRAAYVGMVKQPTNESTEFQIHSEDFPALPGSQAQESLNSDSSNKLASSNNSETSKDSRYPGDKSIQVQKRGIQTSPEGKVTNIPGGMVVDQFGMVGLLTFIRAAETDPNLVSLALGSDLTTLGLNLNSPDNLYPTFGGPFSEVPCRPQDIDFHVPLEYLTNVAIRDKLAQVKLNRYGEDLLFYMFYTNGGDVLQLAAASELYNRDWRYHKEERVWVTRAPGMVPVEKTSTYERGTYYFFDAEKWRKVAKEFHLDYEKLEDRPHLPPSFQVSATQAGMS